MVVLTALLVKAAYDRYSSDDNSNNNNDNTSISITQQTTNSSDNTTTVPVSPIKFTREHSFRLLHSLRSPSTVHQNYTVSKKMSFGSVGNGGGVDGEETRRFTRHGNYILDGKRGMLALPSEVKSSTTNTNTLGGETMTNGQTHSHAQMKINNGGEAETTFRNDIRNEWIDAIFGKDFYPLSSTHKVNITVLNHANNVQSNGGSVTSSATVAMDELRIGIRQGVGEANVPHYVTYGAIVDPVVATRNAVNGGGDVSTPRRRVVESKTQSTPIVMGEGGDDDPSIVTHRDADGKSSSVGAAYANGTIMNRNGVYQTPLRNGSGGSGSQPGISTIPSSTTTTTTSTINKSTTTSSNNNNNNKLGITISRIPLGLHVKSISIHSEAYSAGISPGSILVSINEMGMLGERSDRALERLWMYAGLLLSGAENGGSGKNNELREDGEGSGNTPNSTTATTATTTTSSTSPSSAITTSSPSPHEDNLQVKRPIQLVLYKNGHLYTVLLLSGHPLNGIEWAPVATTTIGIRPNHVHSILSMALHGYDNQPNKHQTYNKDSNGMTMISSII